MELYSIDIAVIFAYLALTVLSGFWISKRASKDLDSYFLGGKSLPWYILGISNASGQFDITGTMWLVYLCFVSVTRFILQCWKGCFASILIISCFSGIQPSIMVYLVGRRKNIH